MIDQETWEGVAYFLDHYAKVTPNDYVVMAYTPDACEAAAWVASALKFRQIITSRVVMGPVADEGFCERLAGAIPSPEQVNGKLILMAFECDTFSHTPTFHDALKAFSDDHCTVLRVISAYKELFSDAIKVDPSELSALIAR